LHLCEAAARLTSFHDDIVGFSRVHELHRDLSCRVTSMSYGDAVGAQLHVTHGDVASRTSWFVGSRRRYAFCTEPRSERHERHDCTADGANV
jgi:hypothetical protein